MRLRPSYVWSIGIRGPAALPPVEDVARRRTQQAADLCRSPSLGANSSAARCNRSKPRRRLNDHKRCIDEYIRLQMQIREIISFSFLGLGLVLAASYLGLFRSSDSRVPLRRAFITAPQYPAVEAVILSNHPSPSQVSDAPSDNRALVAETPVASEPWPDNEAALIEELQKELVRLGCYSGEPNSRWTSAVALAVKDMTVQLNARLPTENPHPAHLALARAQTDPVCGTFHISASTGDRKDQADRTHVSRELPSTYRMSLGALEGTKKKVVRPPSRKKGVRHRARNLVQQRFIHPLEIR